LKKKLLKVSKNFGINKKFLDRRYKEKDKKNEDASALQSIAKDPNFYAFIMNNLLDK